MSFDIERARADTPGCHDVIHLNNAGGSLPPMPVTEAMIEYLRFEATVGGYEAADARAEAATRYRSAGAELVGADPAEIAFSMNDTDGFARVFWGLVHTNALPASSTVLVDRTIYVSHYLALLQAQRAIGLNVSIIDSDDTGAIDLDSLASLLTEEVSLVTLTHVGTHRGLVNPVEAAGALIRQQSNAVFVLDACQSLGQVIVDVEAIGCDAFTATGRKYLRAPRGTGLLYVSNGLVDRIDPPGLDGSGAAWIDAASYEPLPDARRMEPFETSVAGKIGLGVALDYLHSFGIEAIAGRVDELAEHLRQELTRAGIEVLDGGHVRSGIVTFRRADQSPTETQAALAAAAINTSVAGAGSARLDMEQRGVESAVRASVHYYNTTDELDRVVATLTT